MNYPHFSRQVLNTLRNIPNRCSFKCSPVSCPVFQVLPPYRFSGMPPAPTANVNCGWIILISSLRAYDPHAMAHRDGQQIFTAEIFKRHGSLRPNAAWCICAFNKVCCNELKCGMPFRHQNAQNTTILMIHYTMIDGELQEFWLKGVCKSVTNH